MNIDIITKAIQIYQSENSLSYGFNISGNIDESNYSENVEWNNGLDADSKGIPMEAPITWSDLQAYITKANTEIASLPTREDIKTTKASAKAKLIAGQPLTEAEADTLII